jgi:histidinol dehydrogenase
LELSAENLYFVATRDLAEAVALSNKIAPEHLELQVRDPESLLPSIKNAGAILLGDYTGVISSARQASIDAAEAVAVFAEAEGFDAHSAAARVRATGSR